MNEAVTGFIGVVLGASISVIKDYVAHRTGSRRRGRFAAVRIICVLDLYLEKCVEVVIDDGTEGGRPAGENGYHEAQVNCPPPPSFPDDIDWTTIDPALAYRILSLPNQAHETDRTISFWGGMATPPDYSEFFSTRSEGYTDLGLEAVSIADELRGQFTLPKISVIKGDPDWDSAQYLRAQKVKFQRRIERAGEPA